MDPGTSVLKFLMMLVPLVFKLLLWTGLIFPLIPVAIAYLINSPEMQDFVGSSIYGWGTLIFCALFVARKLITGVKPDFTYTGLFKKGIAAKEKRATNPKASGKLLQMKPTGVVFGKQRMRWACKPTTTDGHIAIFGGAGSGKSSKIVVPTLLSWDAPVFAIDVKGALYEQTAHSRQNKRNKQVKVFDPTDEQAHGYDPFLCIADTQSDPQQAHNGHTADIQEIAHALIAKPADIKEPFWVDGARNYLTSGLLYFYEQNQSFVEALTSIQSTPAPELVEEIAAAGSRDARLFINQFVGMDEKTLAGITSEMSNQILTFTTDPQLRAALSKPDNINPADLENGEDIYLRIPEHQLDRWSGLVTLMVNQFLKAFERRGEGEGEPILFCLDEFPRLRKIEAVTTGMATLRSKRITVMLVAQSLGQLDLIYGEHQRKVLCDNAAYTAVLSATDADSQEYFSKRAGTYDKTFKNSSSSSQALSIKGSSAGISTSEQERRVIKPEDFGSLSAGNTVLLYSPQGFSRLTGAAFYENRGVFPLG